MAGRNLKIKAWLGELTLEEKAGLCSGKDFWHLKGVERLGIPEIMVTDGPHGLRKQVGSSDHVGLADSVPSTCFPTASATASSWDINLMQTMGVALGEECQKEEVAVILGPGLNIKRSPLCGRNFEYLSEDPFLAGEMAASLVNGIQSQGVGTSMKHFAANNQEYRRMATDSVVDERALREIYLSAFEKVVKKAQPWTVMCAYNKLNGTYCSDHKWLLTTILKEAWGHTGLVVTDWGACSDRVLGIKAGMELEMPASGGLNDRKIIEAVEAGDLSIDELDRAVTRILDLILKAQEGQKTDFSCDMEAHHHLARTIAAKSAVLLKNEGVLPLGKEAKIGVFGEFARSPRYQGAGSSLINPYKLSSALDGLTEKGIPYDFYPAYKLTTDMVDEPLMAEAIEGAKAVDTALVFVGLTEDFESEGFDRKHLSLPYVHNKLVEKVAEHCPKVIVVLYNGAPVTMPWLHQVDGVLEGYLGGQAGGPAMIDLIYGDVNPSGKLAETFPLALEDDLATKEFGNAKKSVLYKESIYIGYRYYDKAEKAVLFPFGHGLSYTKFEYENLHLSESQVTELDTLTAYVTIKNVGERAGEEVVQLYISAPESAIYRAKKELKGFAKVYLEAGESKEVMIQLDARSFAFYNTLLGDWHVLSGDYEIWVGGSSADLPLVKSVSVSGLKAPVPDYRSQAPVYYDGLALSQGVSDQAFEALLGRSLPKRNPIKGEAYTINSTIGDIKHTLIGKQIYKLVAKQFGGMMASETPGDETTKRMMEAMVEDLPIRSMVLFSGGQGLDFKKAQMLVDLLNGQVGSLVKSFLKKQ